MSDPIIEELVDRYPVLGNCASSIREAVDLLTTCLENGGTLLICGNGGSAADAEHIVGELMKSFELPRPVDTPTRAALNDDRLASMLQGALRAIALSGSGPLATAIANDISAETVFAQQVLGYGRPGDVLWGLSTSGNSLNVLNAAKVAHARGMRVFGMTGTGGGALASHCDVCVGVPETETWKVQELHFPIYHAICRILERRFFGRPE